MNPASLRRRLWLVAFLMAMLASPQSAGPVFPDPGNAHMSRDKQRELGLRAAAQVYQQMPALPDNSPETQYVRKLGEKLVATIPPQNSWPFEFHVVLQKEINAFALPGGPMFVNIGTLTATAHEAELAGVMAHEMSHVYMQHSAKQQQKAQWTQGLAGLAGGIIGATTGGVVGDLAQTGVQFGAQGVMLKYSRGDESQADAVGTVILYKAGYDPHALADFFSTLQTHGGGSPPQFLSDHPNPGNRRQAIEKEVRNWPPKQYAGDSPEFLKVRQHAMGVKAYTAEEIAQGEKAGQWVSFNARNGAASNASVATPVSPRAPAAAVSLQTVLPSQQMVPIRLGQMEIARPENWPVKMPQDESGFITIAPEAGVTANGVGYGVLISGAKTSGRYDIDDITKQLVQELQRSQGVKPLGKASSLDVNGAQGRSVMMQSTSPFPSSAGQQQLERDWLVTVPHPNGAVVFFVFIAPQSEFSRFQPAYEAMLKSLQF